MSYGILDMGIHRCSGCCVYIGVGIVSKRIREQIRWLRQESFANPAVVSGIADSMDKMLAVVEAARYQLEMLDSIDSTAKYIELIKALTALDSDDD